MTTTCRVRPGWALAAGLLFAACESPRPDPSAVALSDDYRVTDSAGVRIVTLSRPLPGVTRDVTGFRHRVWRTGWRDDEPWFKGVKSGYLLPRGGAVVADGATRKIYVLVAGEVDVVFGRRGEGPGEFERIDAVAHLPPDSILVTDGHARRVSVFSSDGEFERSFPLPTIGRYGYLSEEVVAGRLLYLPYASFYPSTPIGRPWQWVDAPLLSSDLVGEELDTLTMPPHAESSHAGELPSGHYPRHGVLGAHSGGWVWASNTDTSIHWYAPDGTLTRTFRAADSHYDGRAFSQLVVARNGSVWRGEDLTFAGPLTYSVVSPSGRALRFKVPSDFRILDIADGRILAVHENELDIEAVSVVSFDPISVRERMQNLVSRWLR